ncbi:MAG: glycine cleavage system aminomethyltransferase GcvT [Actinomycetota bacterium]|nr:glycine cleavage system aminomethyltransferase GcvT [Actinomycetota bacterium]
MSLRRSPLHSEHEALGAKLVDFGGWEMPLAYRSGTIAEHLACRHAAAAFDVSHLGTVRVTGDPATIFELLQRTLSNDLRKVGPGRAQYTHLLDPSDASVLDDIIVWWVAADRFDVMPNASNTERVLAALEGAGADATARRAVVAVQGPAARETVTRVSPGAAAVERFHVTEFEFRGVACLAAGTGYTGEDGLECAIPTEPDGVAAEFWRAVVDAGAAPAGLGARDTLRLEAGLPLHGHELGPGITPLQAGLGWVVGWDKEDFRGREALERERSSGGPHRLLGGLVADSRRPPRAESPIVDESGTTLGEVTSGNFSPVLERGIALGFMPPGTREGTRVRIDVRGTELGATTTRPPFHRPRTP